MSPRVQQSPHLSKISYKLLSFVFSFSLIDRILFEPKLPKKSCLQNRVMLQVFNVFLKYVLTNISKIIRTLESEIYLNLKWPFLSIFLTHFFSFQGVDQPVRKEVPLRRRLSFTLFKHCHHQTIQWKSLETTARTNEELERWNYSHWRHFRAIGNFNKFNNLSIVFSWQNHNCTDFSSSFFKFCLLESHSLRFSRHTALIVIITTKRFKL